MQRYMSGLCAKHMYVVQYIHKNLTYDILCIRTIRDRFGFYADTFFIDKNSILNIHFHQIKGIKVNCNFCKHKGDIFILLNS